MCEQVAAERERGRQVVIVTSGAIAIGMRAMALPVRPSGMDELQAASAVGQGALYREYADRLTALGMRPAQVLLTFFDMSARTHYLNARQTLRRLLAWDVVPVINENDTTTTDEISFGDNDFLAAQVAILLQAEELLLFTDTDGLFTADPRRDERAELIHEVREFEALEGLEIGVSGSPFRGGVLEYEALEERETGVSSSPIGSGGMRSKVVAAEMSTAAGIPARIVNGRKPEGVAAGFARDEAGTLFLPQAGRVSSFKLWLKYAKPTQGRVVVDDGAAAALRERNSSLLPVGITNVEGDFEPGDAVEVTANGRAIGKGIVNYSAAELRRVVGLKTAEIRELLPRAADEAVHRDYFVLD